jgi:3',5'-cyclic AMP phosphodiesterase CpdA
VKRLAWVTDVHLNFLDAARIEAFCATIVAAGPDAIVITGDIAEAHDLEGHLATLERRLARPVYFVLGNHDFYRGSIAGVRRRMAELTARSRHLRWLPAEGIVELTSQTALVGHDGWADGRNGDYATSRLLFSDWVHIEELAGLGRAARLARLNALGDEAAAHLEEVLPRALACFRHVIVLSHVPPFAEACRYEGRVVNDEWLPHLSCKAAGDVLRRFAFEHPDARLTVLAGHTHNPADVDVLPNLRARTGAAAYGAPALADIVVVP